MKILRNRGSPDFVHFGLAGLGYNFLKPANPLFLDGLKIDMTCTNESALTGLNFTPHSELGWRTVTTPQNLVQGRKYDLKTKAEMFELKREYKRLEEQASGLCVLPVHKIAYILFM